MKPKPEWTRREAYDAGFTQGTLDKREDVDRRSLYQSASGSIALAYYVGYCDAWYGRCATGGLL